MKRLRYILILLILAACRPSQTIPQSSPTPLSVTNQEPLLSNPSPTSKPGFTQIPLSPTFTPAPIVLSNSPQICSPLQDISLAELPEIVSNPFAAPQPGMDDGHHGVDLAYYQRGTHKQMLGLPVQSVLSGKIAGITDNRPPYGNMLIIESPLADIPMSVAPWLHQPLIPTPVPANIRLSCPKDLHIYPADPGQQSLYLLYAHLQNPPQGKLGEEVGCGQQIGNVGNTGASGNPHLHLEIRIGPAGSLFSQMAHYIASATSEEMRNYCIWRVSGSFQMIDPIPVLIGKSPNIIVK